MGSYGIGLGRNVACIVEAHHDEKGIAWPAAVAPYAAHLVAIGANKEPPGRRDRRAASTTPRRPPAATRDPVRRSRRVAGREVHRCRAARACPGSSPSQPALARRGRRRGDRTARRARSRSARWTTSRRSSWGASRRPRPEAPRRLDRMPGQVLPDDDLYATLQLTPDASPEAIDLGGGRFSSAITPMSRARTRRRWTAPSASTSPRLAVDPTCARATTPSGWGSRPRARGGPGAPRGTRGATRPRRGPPRRGRLARPRRRPDASAATRPSASAVPRPRGTPRPTSSTGSPPRATAVAFLATVQRFLTERAPRTRRRSASSPFASPTPGR